MLIRRPDDKAAARRSIGLATVTACTFRHGIRIRIAYEAPGLMTGIKAVCRRACSDSQHRENMEEDVIVGLFAQKRALTFYAGHSTLHLTKE